MSHLFVFLHSIYTVMIYRNMIFAALAMTMLSCGSKKEVVKESSAQTETVSNEKGAQDLSTKKETTKQVKIKAAIETFQVKGVSFNMILVQGGTFAMGASPEQGKYADATEKPLHKVTLSEYYIGETEVTQELWSAVMGSNPAKYKGEGFPVESVSWTTCQTFLKRLSTMTGKTFRLPTEAEWEFAARGGKSSKNFMYSGSNNWSDVAIRDKYAATSTYKVASKQPNELGIYDMSGNVIEWCEDWYGDYTSGAQTNPKGPQSGESRIYRGGSATMPETFYRVSSRDGAMPDRWFYTVGLRLAMTD